MSDPLVATALDTLVDLLRSLIGKHGEARIRQDNEVAQYFAELASLIEKMRSQLAVDTIPRADGHAFEELVRAFPMKTKRIPEESLSGRLEIALHEVSVSAGLLNANILIRQPLIEASKAGMLAEMDRVVGQLRGLGGALRRDA
jgi:hypothetical protein